MNSETQNDLPVLETLLRLRLLVAFLGEKGQYAWWTSSFLGPTGAAVLTHMYPRTTHLAQYHGALEAARKVHDDLIGVGQVFHLFRAHEETEQDLHALILACDSASFHSLTSGTDASRTNLHALAGESRESLVGPVLIGEPSALLSHNALRRVAATYIHGFEADQKAFPYFKAV